MAERIPDGALLALDLGKARIGVAACGPERILAYPVATIAAGSEWRDQVAGLVEDYRAVAVVVGLPLGLDGRPGIAAAAITERARELAGRIGVAIWLVDERLTSAEANQRLREAGRNSRTSRGVVDAQAAVGILESVLRALTANRAIGQRLEVE